MAVDKYPVYRRRRRAPGRLLCGRKEWDNKTVNQWVVPYNPFLSQKYNCHINVEVCATSKAVKYIYKYVYKGADMTMVTIEGEIQGHSNLQMSSCCCIFHWNSLIWLKPVCASYSRIHAQRRKAGNPFTRTKRCNLPRTCEQRANSQVDSARRQDNFNCVIHALSCGAGCGWKNAV
ncbi:Helitron helicase-like protein [Phytophthora palmivora]|uniref:Helitron helicase-like protein n=1 Tax=Phytophthora palmivora TaxID=4796 RepID=A0A2P4YHW3_9STRA|nr:Helitron helicase-like protein [Phytophthora palmivora]